MPGKRKHVATGKRPPGGAREGAGRKPGTSLPSGAVAATRAFSRNLDGLSAEQQALNDEAFDVYVKVMKGKVARGALFRLMAARHVREELSKPIPKQLEHTGPGGGELKVSINISRAPKPTPTGE